MIGRSPFIQVVLGAPLLLDHFTDGDGVGLAAHTMNAGGGWAIYGHGTTSYTIAGNQAALTAADGATGDTDFAAADALASDCTVQAGVSANGVPGALLGVCGRMSDQNNGWAFVTKGGTQLALYRLQAGVLHLVVSQSGYSDTGRTLAMVFAADSISCFLDGVDVIDVSGFSFNQTATLFGIYGGTSASWRWDDFRVTSP